MLIELAVKLSTVGLPRARLYRGIQEWTTDYLQMVKSCRGTLRYQLQNEIEVISANFAPNRLN